MVITNTATNGGALTIDAFQILAASPPTTATTTNTTNTNTTTSSSDGNSNSSGPNGGAIAGAVIAVILVLLLILAAVFFFLRRQRNKDEHDRPDMFSMAYTSYIERVRSLRFSLPTLPGRRKAGLSRSTSRGSEETAVDPESGDMEHTQKKKLFGYGIGLGGRPRKWLDNLKGLVVQNPDPVTPPLPVQNQYGRRERPVIDIRNTTGGNGVSPGMVTVGLDTGVPGASTTTRDRDQNHNPNAAQVWIEGTRRIEAGRRFSDQSLEQAWDNRGHPTGTYNDYGHRRNQSTPAVSVQSIICSVSLMLTFYP